MTQTRARRNTDRADDIDGAPNTQKQNRVFSQPDQTASARPSLLSRPVRTQCFCGEASDDPTELSDASCTYACAGDASQTCGGPSAITVYEYETVATRPGYLGCWEDTKAIRIMNAMESGSSMTNDVRRFPSAAAWAYGSGAAPIFTAAFSSLGRGGFCHSLTIEFTNTLFAPNNPMPWILASPKSIETN